MKIVYILAALALSLAACAVPAGNLAPTPSPSPSPSPSVTPSPAPGVTPSVTPSPGVTPSPAPASCLVETGQPAGTVYIRSGPGMSWPVSGYATQGERLELTGRTDPAGWAEVRQESGLAGWFYVIRWCKE